MAKDRTTIIDICSVCSYDRVLEIYFMINNESTIKIDIVDSKFILHGNINSLLGISYV